MSEEEIKKILNKFDKVLENYEIDKKCGQFTIDSICHLFPNEMIVIKESFEEMKEDIEDYERIFDIWNKRKLINKFNKEFSKKTVKEERAKGNKIVGAIPDAEYVYKKYYEKVEQLDLYKNIIDKATEYLETQIQEGRSESNLWLMGCYDEDKKILEILQGGNNGRQDNI